MKSLLGHIEFEEILKTTKLSDIIEDAEDIYLEDIYDDQYKAEDILSILEYVYKKARINRES